MHQFMTIIIPVIAIVAYLLLFIIGACYFRKSKQGHYLPANVAGIRLRLVCISLLPLVPLTSVTT
jgi:hypothetical protein